MEQIDSVRTYKDGVDDHPFFRPTVVSVEEEIPVIHILETVEDSVGDSVSILLPAIDAERTDETTANDWLET